MRELRLAVVREIDPKHQRSYLGICVTCQGLFNRATRSTKREDPQCLKTVQNAPPREQHVIRAHFHLNGLLMSYVSGHHHL